MAYQLMSFITVLSPCVHRVTRLLVMVFGVANAVFGYSTKLGGRFAADKEYKNKVFYDMQEILNQKQPITHENAYTKSTQRAVMVQDNFPEAVDWVVSSIRDCAQDCVFQPPLKIKQQIKTRISCAREHEDMQTHTHNSMFVNLVVSMSSTHYVLSTLRICTPCHQRNSKHV